MKPNPGVDAGSGFEPEIGILFAHCGFRLTIRLRPDNFCEPPIADPHDGWCGEGRLITVPYPIIWASVDIEDGAYQQPVPISYRVSRSVVPIMQQKQGDERLRSPVPCP